nr:MAG TPA: hypothetical protein [Caudoviricetes sp.]
MRLLRFLWVSEITLPAILILSSSFAISHSRAFCGLLKSLAIHSTLSLSQGRRKSQIFSPICDKESEIFDHIPLSVPD